MVHVRSPQKPWYNITGVTKTKAIQIRSKFKPVNNVDHNKNKSAPNYFGNAGVKKKNLRYSKDDDVIMIQVP
jgi:hypothetical protein